MGFSLWQCSEPSAMFKVLSVFTFLILHKRGVYSYPDLTPEAITVYRNPDFFKNLNYGAKIYYGVNRKPSYNPQGRKEFVSGNPDDYKYPGETKKPNPPPITPVFEVNFDNSPEFHHQPRDIFVDTTYKPKPRKGPYSPQQNPESKKEESSRVRQPEAEAEEESQEVEEEEDKSSSNEEYDSEEKTQDFSSLLSSSPDEEFKAYHEPILLARPGFDPDIASEFASSTYSQPYKYNKTSPLLYEDWKFYNYPKIYRKDHLKADSSPLYSEEPASNAFDGSESSSYYKYDDETEDPSNFFENNDFKDLASDTKHIYKKLLKPKKSVLFKYHSKPKFKKLKFKLKKKHLHDWFNEHPFDF